MKISVFGLASLAALFCSLQLATSASVFTFPCNFWPYSSTKYCKEFPTLGSGIGNVDTAPAGNGSGNGGGNATAAGSANATRSLPLPLISSLPVALPLI